MEDELKQGALGDEQAHMAMFDHPLTTPYMKVFRRRVPDSEAEAA